MRPRWNYKHSDEIQEWRSQLDLASSAVEVYRQGWQVLAKANPIVICCFAYEDADFSERGSADESRLLLICGLVF